MTVAQEPGVPGPLQLLSATADALAGGADLDATMQTLLEIATRALAAQSGAIFLQDPDRVGLEPAVATGIDRPAFERLGDAIGRTGDPVAATAGDGAGRRESGDEGGFLQISGSRRGVFEPLVVSRGGIDQTLGVLALGWREAGDLTPSDESTLAALTRLIAVAVDHGRLASLVSERSEWFERMAQSDPLTGLANMRTFGRVLELELARAARQGSDVSLALFDVDGFEATNEAGGHAAGDDVLRAVAAVLGESVRLVDTIGRMGGDEFVLLAPGAAGMTVARRVLSGVARLEPVANRPISVSAGVARFPTDGSSAEELLAAAQAALDRAKANGAGTLHEASTQATG